MIIYLPNHINKHDEPLQLNFVEDSKQQNRFPAHLVLPCTIDGWFKVEKCNNYWSLTFSVNSTLQLRCQRCLHAFTHTWQQQTEIAVCSREDIAIQLLTNHETFVAPDLRINLHEIIIDELHFSLPEKHHDEQDCIFA